MRFNYKENHYMQLRGSKQAAVAGGAVVTAALALAACSSSSSSSSSTPASSTSSSPAAGTSSSAAALSGTINASGSTFQTNFQQSAIQGFKTVQPGVTVNYGGGGSGAGRTALYSGTVLFAGSDSPIPASEMSKVPAGKTVLYFPVQIGPIAIAYNLSGVSGLKLDAPTLAKIFQGQITTWNDPAIKALNPSASLPTTPITLAVRSDSSGTTQNFSAYLVKAAGSAWKLGTASTITWPKTAHAANGGSGLAQAVKSTPGAIGYVDFSTATASGLTAATIKNSSGDFVAPSTAGATAAAQHVTPAANLTFSTVDEPGATSYPITYQSWDLLYEKQPNANDAALLKAYIGYLLGSSGQALLTPLNLAPLPSAIDSAAVAQLSKITS
jgi:phosphate transport system substrate-binding protein